MTSTDGTGGAGPGLLVGERYRVEQRIGGGAMGTVWLARDEVLGRAVALKQVNPAPGATREERAQQVERALREGRTAARLRNAHAVTVLDVAVHDDEPWLVLEHVPSTDLAQLVAAEQVLPVEQVAQVGAQVADALAEAHAAGIVHRDVKPANVLVGRGGEHDEVVKLTDFGIAHATGEVGTTEAGTITGTPAYFAPEQARGGAITPASDVFSLGATLFTCLESVPPFGLAENPYAMIDRVADGTRLPSTRAGELEPVLARMLATDPAERPTAAEARDELAAVAAGRRDAVPAVLAARTRLVPLGRAAAGLGAAAVAGAGIGALAAGSGGAAGAGSAVAGAGSAVAGAGSTVAGAGSTVAGAGSTVAGAGSAAGTAATGAVTTATGAVAKTGGLGALLSKPFVLAGAAAAVLVVGGGAAVALSGSADAPPAAVAQTTTTPPTTTAPAVAAADAAAAVTELVAGLTDDPSGTLAEAGPALQAVGGGVAADYVNRVEAIGLGAVDAQDGGAVTAELEVTLADGSTTIEPVAFTVTDPAAASTSAGPASSPAPSTTVPPTTATGSPGARALVVDSPQLAALLAAGPPTTSAAPTSTTAPSTTAARPTPTPAPGPATTTSATTTTTTPPPTSTTTTTATSTPPGPPDPGTPPR